METSELLESNPYFPIGPTTPVYTAWRVHRRSLEKKISYNIGSGRDTSRYYFTGEKVHFTGPPRREQSLATPRPR